MIDSCSARKVEPGFAAQYSMPSDLMTSTMKSDPGRSVVYTSARGAGGEVSAATRLADGNVVPGRACAVWAGACAPPAPGFATRAAAPIAAPLRNPLRFTEGFLDFAMVFSPSELRRRSYWNWGQRAISQHTCRSEVQPR